MLDYPKYYIIDRDSEEIIGICREHKDIKNACEDVQTNFPETEIIVAKAIYEYFPPISGMLEEIKDV